jgi:alpha-L-rhamnosidase
VASSPEKLTKGESDLWDSGRAASDQSHLVTYRGRSLSSLQRAFWRVKCWDQAGAESAWSAQASWTMGVLKPEDWNGARWIGLRPVSVSSSETVIAWARHAARAGEKHAGTAEYLASHYPPAPFFRREFVCKQKPVRACAVISGAGYYRLFLNGKPASERMLDPVYTDYNHHAMYVVEDITAQVHEGANAAGIILGGGFYESGYSIGLPQFEYGENGGLFGFILLEYADEVVPSVVGTRR